jgi:hypothetical protein
VGGRVKQPFENDALRRTPEKRESYKKNFGDSGTKIPEVLTETEISAGISPEF